MTVQQLTEQLSLTVFHLDDPDRAVTGGYCGDLLSWVMGRAPADGAWLTAPEGWPAWFVCCWLAFCCCPIW